MSEEFEVANAVFGPLIFTICIAVFHLLPAFVLFAGGRSAAIAMAPVPGTD